MAACSLCKTNLFPGKAGEGVACPAAGAGKQQLLQTGEIDTAFSDSTQERCRLNIYRLGSGYAAAIRLLPKEIPDCNSLGLPQIVSQLADSSSGLLLVTGATGSGKAPRLPRWYSR